MCSFSALIDDISRIWSFSLTRQSKANLNRLKLIYSSKIDSKQLKTKHKKNKSYGLHQNNPIFHPENNILGNILRCLIEFRQSKETIEKRKKMRKNRQTDRSVPDIFKALHSESGTRLRLRTSRQT